MFAKAVGSVERMQEQSQTIAAEQNDKDREHDLRKAQIVSDSEIRLAKEKTEQEQSKVAQLGLELEIKKMTSKENEQSNTLQNNKDVRTQDHPLPTNGTSGSMVIELDNSISSTESGAEAREDDVATTLVFDKVDGGSSASGSGGDITISVRSGDQLGGSLTGLAGDSSANYGGDASMAAGSSATTSGGELILQSDDDNASGGVVAIEGGDGATDLGGSISISSGVVAATSSGSVAVSTGDAETSGISGGLNTGLTCVGDSGDVVIIGSGSSASGSGGDITISVGSGGQLGGSLTGLAGDSSANDVAAGSSVTTSGGELILQSDDDNASGGVVAIEGGDGATDLGGSISISSGVGAAVQHVVSHGDENNEILGEDVAIEIVSHMPTIAGKQEVSDSEGGEM